jgi:GTP-binding protein
MAESRIVRARFVASVADSAEMPPGPPELALVGRSNVGKSSLLNAICGEHGLARVSRTPGRTQRVNVFDADLDDGRILRLADLPGFGYAAVDKRTRRALPAIAVGWIETRLSLGVLKAVVLLQDLRRERDEDAIGFADHVRGLGGRIVVIATKADEVPKNRREPPLQRLKREFALPRPPIATSIRDASGLDELRRILVRACEIEP